MDGIGQCTRAPDWNRLPPGDIVLGTTSFDLAPLGYVAEEYRIEGEAIRYALAGERAEEGRWTLTQTTRAPYVTRLVIYRPSDPKAFSGTALIEWINVSPSSDVAPMWLWAHREMMRAGHLWIGLSVQRAGIEGGGFYPGPLPPLKAADPERYGCLSHPGDAWSFDIFSQGARLVREQAGSKRFLMGYCPRRLFALGASQSAMFLVAYINGLGPLHRLFDGYMLSGRIGTCATFDGIVPSEDVGIRIREDAGVPAITVQSETDRLVGLDLGRLVNSGPQQHYVLQAALAHLVRWADGGAPPPIADRLRVLEVDLPRFETDEVGHARGGIRSPWVDAPRALLSGFYRADIPPPLSLFGATTPFDAETFARLYGSKDAYLKRFDEELEKSVSAGFVLAADTDEIRALARWTEAIVQ